MRHEANVSVSFSGLESGCKVESGLPRGAYSPRQAPVTPGHRLVLAKSALMGRHSVCSDVGLALVFQIRLFDKNWGVNMFRPKGHVWTHVGDMTQIPLWRNKINNKGKGKEGWWCSTSLRSAQKTLASSSIFSFQTEARGLDLIYMFDLQSRCVYFKSSSDSLKQRMDSSLGGITRLCETPTLSSTSAIHRQSVTNASILCCYLIPACVNLPKKKL